jgi:hypothetical protein
LFGGALAFGLAATSTVSRLDVIFSGMGDVFAPVVGAMAGDWLRQRGRWSGLRCGIHVAGVMAWGAGFGIAITLDALRIVDPANGRWCQPTAIYGFFTAAAVYWVMDSLAQRGRDVRSA